MVEDNKQAEAAQAEVEKSPDVLAAEAEAKAAKEAKAKAKKEAAAANKALKEAKKNERLRKRQEDEAAKNVFVKDPNDPCAEKFGDLPLNRS